MGSLQKAVDWCNPIPYNGNWDCTFFGYTVSYGEFRIYGKRAERKKEGGQLRRKGQDDGKESPGQEGSGEEGRRACAREQRALERFCGYEAHDGRV